MSEKKITVSLTAEELLALKQLVKTETPVEPSPIRESKAEVREYYDQPVSVYLHPYGTRETLTAVVNGVTYQIRRGVAMRIPRRVARVIRQAEENYRRALAFDRRIMAQG